MRAILDWTAYAALRLGETLVRSLPPRAAVALGDACGAIWYVLDRRRRRRAAENLRVAFGDELDATARRRLIRQVFQSLARVPFESLLMPRLLGSRRRFFRRCRMRGDVEAFFHHAEHGPAAILVSGHLGNWELGGYALRSYPVPFAGVARPIENRYIDRHAVRARGGRRIVIRRRGALQSVVAALRRGTWVGFVADQNGGNRGEYVPFFGLDASTHGAPAWIACREGRPFYVGACLRRGNAPLCYDVHVKQLPHPNGADASPDDIRALVASSMAELEALIRIDPAQYNWLHRRWKDRPRDEVPGPHLPQYDHHRPPTASA